MFQWYVHHISDAWIYLTHFWCRFVTFEKYKFWNHWNTIDYKVPKTYEVETGTANGMLTEIKGGITAGTEVLVDFKLNSGEAEEQQQAGNPFMPRPRNNKSGNNQQKK